MYRPEGWAKIKRELCNERLKEVGGAHCETCPAEPLTCGKAGEALVDAMLKALKKENGVGSLYDTGLAYNPVKGLTGLLIVIPEEKSNGNNEVS